MFSVLVYPPMMKNKEECLGPLRLFHEKGSSAGLCSADPFNNRDPSLQFYMILILCLKFFLIL